MSVSNLTRARYHVSGLFGELGAATERMRVHWCWQRHIHILLDQAPPSWKGNVTSWKNINVLRLEKSQRPDHRSIFQEVQSTPLSGIQCSSPAQGYIA